MFRFRENPQVVSIEPPHAKGIMTRAEVSKLQPADLRLIAARTREAERERKMLALAEQLEERERDRREQEENRSGRS